MSLLIFKAHGSIKVCYKVVWMEEAGGKLDSIYWLEKQQEGTHTQVHMGTLPIFCSVQRV